MKKLNRYWLSFAQGKNLGVIMTKARSVGEAVEKTKVMGINPGGQVVVVSMPAPGVSSQADSDWEKFPKDTLITLEQLHAEGYRTIREQGPEAEETARNDERVQIVCQECNETDCSCN